MTCGHCSLEIRGEHGHPQLSPCFHWGLRPDGQPHLALYVCTACGEWRRCMAGCRGAADAAGEAAPCDPQCMCELRWTSATPGIAPRARLFAPGDAGLR